MPRCWIGLGGNEGNVPIAFADVTRKLAEQPGINRVELSPLFRTLPMGAQAGGAFWNAVAGCDTNIPPLALLDLFQRWELEAGRVRTVYWGPRPLDVDLLFYGDAVIDEPRLRVPHPGAWYRRFVLDPLSELAPEFVHPVWRQTIRELRSRLVNGPPALLLWSDRSGEAESLREDLQPRCLDFLVTISDGVQIANTGLMIAVGDAPAAWRGLPHLRFDPDVPREELLQSVIDVCTAAFQTPAPLGAQG